MREDFLKSQDKNEFMHPYHAAENDGIKDAYLSVIMKSGTIVVKIYVTLIF